MAKQTFTTGQVLTAAQVTSLQQTAMLGGSASAKVASYTLVAADAGTAISMSNASATTITVNTGLFSAGDLVTIMNVGAGTCTITAGSATVNKASGASLALAQYQGGVLNFVSASSAIFFPFDVGSGTSGSMTLINTGGTTLTGSSVTISSIPSTYNALYIVVRNFRPANDGTQLRMRSNVSAAVYATIFQGDSQSISGSDPSWYLTDNQDNATSFSLAICWIYDYANSTTIKFIDTLANPTNNNSVSTNFNYLTQRFGVCNNTTAISELVFSCSTGNFSSGTVFVYGVL